MTSKEPLSRSGITDRADIPNDVMTFWVRRGLLRPIDAPSGMGRHLRFEWYEANIAAVMKQLREIGVPIDGLLSVASKYRQAIAWAADLGVSRAEVFAMMTYRNHLYNLETGNYSQDYFEEMVELWSREDHGEERITDRIKSLVGHADKADFRKFDYTYVEISGQPDRLYRPNPTYFWRVGDDWRFDSNEDGLEKARQDGALGSVAIDVSTVLYHVWNRP